jgi:phenylacetate-CoA ligase
VRCELQREFSGKLNLAADVAAIAKDLQHHIKTNVGVSTHVTVLPFDSIPRTLTGKANGLIDERPKQN